MLSYTIFMPQLTTEYLDKKFEQFADSIEKRLDKKLDQQGFAFDKKLDQQTISFDKKLQKQTKELKAYTNEQVEMLARIVNKGFETQRVEIHMLIGEQNKRIDRVEKDVDTIKKAIMLT